MRRMFLAVLLAMIASQASAQQKIILRTAKPFLSYWTVSEITNGSVASASPLYIGKTPYGNVDGYRIPFKNNDGFWYADIAFTIPQGATNMALHIVALGVDDRVVVELNGQPVTSAGTTAAGSGYMTFTDHGANQPYRFLYASGPEHRRAHQGFQAGVNDLRLIVNNTNSGIGGIPNGNGPTNVGLNAFVTYTMPP